VRGNCSATCLFQVDESTHIPAIDDGGSLVRSHPCMLKVCSATRFCLSGQLSEALFCVKVLNMSDMPHDCLLLDVLCCVQVRTCVRFSRGPGCGGRSRGTQQLQEALSL
jgi:hypothetical protein